MMITLMLVLAMIMLAMLAVMPDLRQQVRRDREEELRHRGTAYMRAIQHFYKKFGRYPTKVEELENTNNLRFLRKRYTDPVNIDPATHKERDFKFLHQQDITLNSGPVLPGQNTPGGQSPPGGLQQGGLGGAQGGLGGLGAQPGGQQPGAGSQDSSGDDSGNSPSGNPSSGNPSSGNSSPGSPSNSGGNSNSTGSPSSGANSGTGLNGQTFGGGPILGVASANKKDKSIHVFYDKDHYNDWFFIYVQQLDRGGLLTGPVSLNAPAGNLGGIPPLPGAQPGPGFGQGGQGQGGFGQGGFGQGGFGQGGPGQGLNGGQNQNPQQQPPPPPQQ